ncbi:pectate lyase, partial [Phenylobacterium sp.]|uniref:pectate lyase n=1 Tax=Phenylobacterium sp. TaxID=1871053 RepID=UPI002E344AFF
LCLEKRDPRYRAPLDRAIGFVLESQHPGGGWPQRWPHADDGPEYMRYITFNDDVAGENIKFLTMVHQTLGDPRALPAIRRAMDSILATQQPAPQPGWGLQHTLDGKPAAARSYEPLALATHTTATNLSQLMSFYELTGDPKYLARVGEGLDWLEKVKLREPRNGRSHPTFIEIGTDRPLYVHRRGSNVVNGEYYVDHSPDRTLGHYSGFRTVDVAGMRARLETLKATPPAEASKGSPLLSNKPVPLPKYFSGQDIATADLATVRALKGRPSAEAVAKILADLNADGWWPSPLTATSHPYRGPGPKTPTPGDYATTHVGDSWDTSPFPDPAPKTGIAIAKYLENMAALIAWLDA